MHVSWSHQAANKGTAALRGRVAKEHRNITWLSAVAKQGAPLLQSVMPEGYNSTPFGRYGLPRPSDGSCQTARTYGERGGKPRPQPPRRGPALCPCGDGAGFERGPKL